MNGCKKLWYVASAAEKKLKEARVDQLIDNI